MKAVKQVVCSLTAAILLTIPVAYAQELTNVKSSSQPITMEADHFHFDDMKQQAEANGHIVVVQNDLTVTGEQMWGDLANQQVIVTQQVVIHQGPDMFTGSQAAYNYGSKQGYIDQADGKLQGFFIKGTRLDFSAGKDVVQNGSITKCPAKVPDYHVTADTVEYYPGDKIVAHNARFWLGKMIIYTQKEYVIDLAAGSDGQSASEWPNVGYRSNVGFSLSKNLVYRLSTHNRFIVSPVYYTKKGFVLDGALVSRQQDVSIRLEQKHWEKDDYWLKASPQFSVTSNAKPLGHYPWTYQYQGNLAYIKEQGPLSTTSGWKNTAEITLRHNSIAITPLITWDTGVDVLQSWYSRGKQMRQSTWFNTVNWKATNKWTFKGELNLSDVTGTSLFGYDKLDIARELAIGGTYTMDHLWTVGSRLSFDLVTGGLHDVDYSVIRNLHCFKLEVDYRAKRDEWHAKVNLAEW